MSIINDSTNELNIRNKVFENMLRSLSQLEKSVDRIMRSNYFHINQYPEIYTTLSTAFKKIRNWIKHYKAFCGIDSFYSSVAQSISNVSETINELWDLCKPKPGKKSVNKPYKKQQQNKLMNSINQMLENVAHYLSSAEDKETLISIELDNHIKKQFFDGVVEDFNEQIIKLTLTSRGEKTYIFPCATKEKYNTLISDKKKFKEQVISKLKEHTHNTGHKGSCQGEKGYSMCGFRQNDRKTIMSNGQRETFRIRMVKCRGCGQIISLLPSFLPREKNFGTDIIANICRSLFLFNQSYQGALEHIKIIGNKGVKSKQTLFNWVKWLGTHHPATLLTRAHVSGNGYFQEDEGFEKEPNLRTYSVVIVDPKTQLVWHADYVDHVDEQTLHDSFKTFIDRISFNVLGVTKDKWKASTNALKKVCHKLWIGYCHRHCLKKFLEALNVYQKETQCSTKEKTRLYHKFKKVLKTSTSSLNLKVKLKSLDDDAFNHPLLKTRLKELEENATHYTAHKNRKGITQTTSIVDNYLKIIKRKLKQVESFRDKNWTRLFFQAQANTRNFVPFNSGAKNAHKSPFMLAGGCTFDLPWLQVMNMHNAFLFTQNAS